MRACVGVQRRRRLRERSWPPRWVRDNPGMFSAVATAVGGRARVEILGSHKCRTVENFQPVLGMIDPMIFTRTWRSARGGMAGGLAELTGGRAGAGRA
jgi:hypothetical protein